MLRELYAVPDSDFRSLLKKKSCLASSGCVLGVLQADSNVWQRAGCMVLPGTGAPRHFTAQQGTRLISDCQYCLAAGRDWVQVREDQNVSLEG